ncbi:hypothetical protein [Olivibacter sp. CPCC 100613]|uniref:hypothetical protein n=1 Tax=Olivibacter sp. CPCC 100613 TaxID=3079931 RepID=UPI002FFBBC31
MYLLGMLLLAYVIPIDNYGVILSTVIYFFLFILVVLVPLYYFSTKRLAKNRDLDMVIEFDEQEITIRHEKTQRVETKGWDWVRRIELTPRELLLVVHFRGRYLIAFPKDKLNESEMQFFLDKMDSRKDIP